MLSPKHYWSSVLEANPLEGTLEGLFVGGLAGLVIGSASTTFFIKGDQKKYEAFKTKIIPDSTISK